MRKKNNAMNMGPNGPMGGPGGPMMGPGGPMGGSGGPMMGPGGPMGGAGMPMGSGTPSNMELSDGTEEVNIPPGPPPVGMRGPGRKGGSMGGPMGPGGPMGFGGPMGPGGPMGGPQQTPMRPPSEEEKAIMPDFPKWRAFFFRLDSLFAGGLILFEVFMLIYSYFTGQIPVSKADYFLWHFGIPTVCYILILVVAKLLQKRMHPMDMRQNFLPIFALVLICIIAGIEYCSFSVTLTIYCIPIAMTTLFSNKMMCRVTTAFCSIGVVTSTIANYITTDTPTRRVWMIPQFLIALAILIVINRVTQALLDMTEGQKLKLWAFTQSIKQEQYRAEAANKAKSAFLANMSHEIRTPINAILGMDEMILRESSNQQITEYAHNIHSASSSLLSLVNDVLDISKIESGKLEIMENNYETSSFIHDCYNMIYEKAQQKKLEVKVECNPDLPVMLRGDEARLRQVVTNLLSNAVKYTKEGSVALCVDSLIEQSKFSLIITVKDTGMGIKEENLKNLFNQFARFDLEKNRNIEGTGLGLAITKQLVDLMHGTIEAQSIYGVGSSFTVVIPQEVINSAPMGNFEKRYRDTATSQSTKYHQSFEAPDARILVVDDMEVNLKVIVNLLKATKIHVDTAISGMDALSLAGEYAYDLIFMDHMMPEMNGVETFSRMREMDASLNRNTPVIMLTANAITGVKEQYLRVGFSDYLSKPILGDKLEKMILKYLPREKISSDYTPDDPDEIVRDTDPANRGTDRQSQSADAAAPADATGNASVLQNLFQAYPQVDLTLGLSYCGNDPEIYIAILQTYAKNDKMEAIQTSYDSEDTENYQILTHGVKSASLSIGFSDLSKLAKALELSAKENDWDSIRKQHGAFMEEYEKALKAIRATVPKEENA